MSFSEIELLARLVQCEAGGEDVLGMQAVASTVMNRVYAMDGEYARVSEGGNIYNIVFQPRQYACAEEVRNGEYNPQNIYNMRPEAIHYEVAEWALLGNRVTDLGDALWFYAPYSQPCRTFFPNQNGELVARIGGHCFYAPTEFYKDT